MARSTATACTLRNSASTAPWTPNIGRTTTPRRSRRRHPGRFVGWPSTSKPGAKTDSSFIGEPSFFTGSCGTTASSTSIVTSSADHVGNSLDERFDYAIAFIGRQWNPPPEDEVVTEFRNRIAPQRRSAGLVLESLSAPDVDTWVAYEHRWAALLNGSYSEHLGAGPPIRRGDAIAPAGRAVAHACRRPRLSSPMPVSRGLVWVGTGRHKGVPTAHRRARRASRRSEAKPRWSRPQVKMPASRSAAIFTSS